MWRREGVGHAGRRVGERSVTAWVGERDALGDQDGLEVDLGAVREGEAVAPRLDVTR